MLLNTVLTVRAHQANSHQGRGWKNFTDAFYLNYNPYVIRECVATNSETVNEVHLTDIDKYLGKVIDMNTFSKMLEEGQL